MELYARVRRAVIVDKMSEREAARQFGLARETVRKMMRYSVPPGYRRLQPVRRPKLGAWIGTIDQILEDDKAEGRKQRHTAKRIFERLRDEHGYAGGYTIVKDYVRLRKVSQREMFVPLAHPPGEAQADFGEAMVVIGGVERKAHSRNYGAVVKDFHNAYGVEKSAMSENFIEASREKIKQLMERPLGELRLCAIVIDGTPFKDRQMIAALGIGCDGAKTVLGIREGATEHTAVVSSLLSELVERGIDFSVPRLYILDGGKALAAAVRKHAGEAGFIQRCQVHKRRNVVDHLPDEYKADVRRKLQNAYSMAGYTEAKRALDQLHRELMDLNPSAARSLEEGMEDTLTVHKLRVPDQLRRTLCCTNVIESAFSIVETVCRNVKRWRDGDHIERWVGSGLLVAERQFRKVIGFRQIPLLLSSMATAASQKSLAKGVVAV
ncbi:MAG: IS256 family transposase [Bryobacterales bacterium]|nr:IS256 family transposase [Bryobacterales bacterium]